MKILEYGAIALGGTLGVLAVSTLDTVRLTEASLVYLHPRLYFETKGHRIFNPQSTIPPNDSTIVEDMKAGGLTWVVISTYSEVITELDALPGWCKFSDTSNTFTGNGYATYITDKGLARVGWPCPETPLPQGMDQWKKSLNLISR